jgi:hypothetical protein
MGHKLDAVFKRLDFGLGEVKHTGSFVVVNFRKYVFDGFR